MLEVQVVPWTNSGPSPDDLTVNRALWALHVLANVDNTVHNAQDLQIHLDPGYPNAFAGSWFLYERRDAVSSR